MGRQVHLQVGEREFYIDLLFYHIKLHCYVVVELKTKRFEPEYVGKLNFYVTAVNKQLTGDGDNPAIFVRIRIMLWLNILWKKFHSRLVLQDTN